MSVIYSSYGRMSLLDQVRDFCDEPDKLLDFLSDSVVEARCQLIAAELIPIFVESIAKTTNSSDSAILRECLKRVGLKVSKNHLIPLLELVDPESELDIATVSVLVSILATALKDDINSFSYSLVLSTLNGFNQGLTVVGQSDEQSDCTILNEEADKQYYTNSIIKNGHITEAFLYQAGCYIAIAFNFSLSQMKYQFIRESRNSNMHIICSTVSA